MSNNASGGDIIIYPPFNTIFYEILPSLYLDYGTFTVQCGNLTERLTCTATTHFGENIR